MLGGYSTGLSHNGNDIFRVGSEQIQMTQVKGIIGNANNWDD